MSWPSHLVLLLFIAAAAPAADNGLALAPRIEPGHVPQLDETERGLWMEVAELERELGNSPLLVRDERLNAYVRDVTCRVAKAYCPDLRVYIVRNPGFNASMAPNGTLQVWTGLLLRAATEDELASVLAHELAHYVMAHTLAQFRRIRTSTGIGSLFSLGIGVATGVMLPIGELAALGDAMAFSRSQETEADLLGAQLLTAAGYEPAAAYRIWQNLVAEDDAAVVKREEGSAFLRTHPGAAQRIENLKKRVGTKHAATSREPAADRHWAVLSDHYLTYMEDQIDTNRYGRTHYLLEQHARFGVDPGLIEFIRGEAHRQSAGQGDSDRAAAAYRRSIESRRAPAEAYRNLGYVAWKKGDRAEARRLFRQYLERQPEASDRAMVEFYLKGEAK